MLAVCNGFHDEIFGNTVAANEFDDNIDVGMIDDEVRIIDDFAFAIRQFTRAFGIEIRHHDNFNGPTCTAADFMLIALQDIECAGADCADAEQANFDRFHNVEVSKIRPKRQTGILADDRLGHRNCIRTSRATAQGDCLRQSDYGDNGQESAQCGSSHLQGHPSSARTRRGNAPCRDN